MESGSGHGVGADAATNPRDRMRRPGRVANPEMQALRQPSASTTPAGGLRCGHRRVLLRQPPAHAYGSGHATAAPHAHRPRHRRAREGRPVRRGKNREPQTFRSVSRQDDVHPPDRSNRDVAAVRVRRACQPAGQFRTFSAAAVAAVRMRRRHGPRRVPQRQRDPLFRRFQLPALPRTTAPLRTPRPAATPSRRRRPPRPTDPKTIRQCSSFCSAGWPSTSYGGKHSSWACCPTVRSSRSTAAAGEDTDRSLSSASPVLCG